MKGHRNYVYLDPTASRLYHKFGSWSSDGVLPRDTELQRRTEQGALRGAIAVPAGDAIMGRMFDGRKARIRRAAPLAALGATMFGGLGALSYAYDKHRKF